MRSGGRKALAMLTRILMPCLIAVPLLGASLTPSAAQAVPVLNVAPTCRNIPSESAMQRDAAACMKSEDEARATLQKEWGAFRADDHSICTQTATMGGTASYVELLTCLEMRRDARNLPKDQLTIREPQAAPVPPAPPKP